MTPPISQYLTEGQQAGARYALARLRRAPQGTAGNQLGRLAGESMEFMDHREYEPGDDLRRLDWSAYARSERMIVKLYRQEVCPHLDVVLDGSRSMALPETDKLRAAVALTAALATAAANSGHTHRAYLTGQGCQPIANGNLAPIVWQGLGFDSAQNPADSFRMLPPAWRPRGIRVLVSDLLWLDEPRELLSTLSDRAAAVYVIQVLAAADVHPPERGNLRLVDAETGAIEELFLDTAADTRYRNNVQRHRENWHRAARQVGAVFLPLVAEDFCRDWDFSKLVEAGMLTA